ncbi:MAG: carboxypeptidase regulatory-like domain-containing protein [Candidatus Poseidoniaceae archaeon]|jgi:hypothetical protein|nr:carboxypeptidase regulatory-like domain-containing protein [Candidatus Poseidoniaceae archaeon]
MTEEKANRLAALRERVRDKVFQSRMDKRRREKAAEDEIVVVAPSREIEFIELESEEISDGERRRKLASVLVMIGALMGMVSGTLILQGNPSDLLNSTLLKENEVLDVRGLIIDGDGYAIEGVNIELIDLETGILIQSVESNSDGRFGMNGVTVKDHQITLSKTNYTSVIRNFTTEKIEMVFTMNIGEEVPPEYEETRNKSGGWSMENAVALATVEGLFTIGCALVGAHASFEIRRAKNYRRTQKLCWVALFSRGLIIFGPALILTGMILLVMNKDEFTDQGEEEDN